MLLLACSVIAFAESPKREFRATWLAAVGVDWPDKKVTTTGNSTQITAQKNELIAYLDQLVASKQNAIFYHVRPMADAFYKSSYEPWSHYLTGTRGKDPGYDPLEFAVAEAHKRGLEIHAWVNPFRHMASGLSSISGASSDPIKKDHPSWLLTYSNGTYSGTWLDPGNPEVRAHVVKVIQEIVNNYDIDGIVFDDYFYPYGGTTTQDATSKSKYKPSSQSDADWRRANIDAAIKAVYDMIAASKRPWVRFGVSPFGIYSNATAPHTKYGVTKPSGITGMDAYGEIYCNTLEWMKAGYVDYVSPQLYWASNESGQQYGVLAQWWSNMAKTFSDKQTGGKKIHFFASQDAGAHATSEIGKQIDYNRSYTTQDAPGSIFFSYDDIIAKSLPSYLKSNKFTQLALPPAMDWKTSATLAAPTGVTLSGSTLSWSHSTADRFTVYAYTKGTDASTAMASSSNLVAVVYGKSLNVSSVSGYLSKTFAVRAYDRYGNEHNAGFYNSAVETPIIRTTPTSFTLTGKVGATVTYDIDVVGLNLTSNMTFASSSPNIVSVASLSGWDDKTGGTLRVTLNTSAATNTTGYIAIQSGQSTRVEVNFTATVQALAPAISVSSSNVSLTGKINTTSAPYKDVTVTASDLTADLSIEHSDLVTVTKLSGWNARTGGTLRLTLNTSKSVGTHNGSVTITSSGVTKPISVSGTITALLPSITPSVTSVLLEGEEGESGVYQDVTISGVDLSSNMTIKTSGDAFTATTPSWNATTGGTLRLTLNTSKAVGTYSGSVTISSGTAQTVISVTSIVNEAYVGPNIKATPSEVTLTAVKGAAKPTAKITVTASGLSRKISISGAEEDEEEEESSSSGGAISYTTSSWNSRTGGTLTISASTATIGTFTKTITLTSKNAQSAVITVTVVITDPNAPVTPSIEATPNPITLSCILNETPAPYVDVTVKASGLSSAMSVAKLISAVNFEKLSDWNDLTGGTLRISANPTYVSGAGTYSSFVALQSGTTREEINYTVTITDPNAGSGDTGSEEPTTGTVVFDSNPIWSKTVTDATYLSTTDNNRSMAYYNGELYIADKAQTGYHVVNAGTGSFVKTVSTGYSTFGAHNLRITSDGQMLLGNTELGTTTTASVMVKAWDRVSSLTQLGTSTISGRCDYFYPYGAWNGSGYLVALSNTGYAVKIPYSAGVLGTAVNINSTALATAGTSAKAIPADANSFYASARNKLPVKYSLSNGAVLEQFGSEKPVEMAAASGLGVFTVHNKTFMVTPTDSLGGFEIFDITDGLGNATRVVGPVGKMGTEANATMTIDFCTWVNGDNAYIYQLVPNNGIRAFLLTYKLDASTTGLDAVSQDVLISPTMEGVRISFAGAQMISIYSVNGTLLYQSLQNDNFERALDKGMYIIKVGDSVHKFIR